MGNLIKTIPPLGSSYLSLYLNLTPASTKRVSDYPFPTQAMVSLGKDPVSALWEGSHSLSLTVQGLKAEGGGSGDGGTTEAGIVTWVGCR